MHSATIYRTHLEPTRTGHARADFDSYLPAQSAGKNNFQLRRRRRCATGHRHTASSGDGGCLPSRVSNWPPADGAVRCITTRGVWHMVGRFTIYAGHNYGLRSLHVARVRRRSSNLSAAEHMQQMTSTEHLRAGHGGECQRICRANAGQLRCALASFRVRSDTETLFGRSHLHQRTVPSPG